MYKDLSLKEKAKVIREGVRLGLNSIDAILNLYDEAIGHKFAEGSMSTPDWDPDNPYHYHTASGEKVVITPEDWEKHKGLPYFKLVEDAVLVELAAHPGPEYIINPQFSEDLRRVYKGNMGPAYQNYSSFSGNLPQEYSFTPEGLVQDNQGNLYVQKGFRLTPRFTYNESNSLTFPVLEGRNQGNVIFYPVNMEKTVKPSLPVNSTMNVNKERDKAISEYIKDNTTHSTVNGTMYKEPYFYPNIDAVDYDWEEWKKGHPVQELRRAVTKDYLYDLIKLKATNHFIFADEEGLEYDPFYFGEDDLEYFDLLFNNYINKPINQIKTTDNITKKPTYAKAKQKAVIKVGPLQVDDVLTYAKGGHLHQYGEPIKQRLDFDGNILSRTLAKSSWDDHDDFSRYFFGSSVPLKDNVLEYSQYKPSVSNNKGVYIAVNDKGFKNSVIDAYYNHPEYFIDNRGHYNGYDHFHNDILTNKKIESKYNLGDLGVFKLGKGVDPYKGDYISYYDIWDGSNTTKNKANQKYYLGAGKAFEVYDRIYLDDYYGVNSTPQEGTYYGGWLAPVTVTPNEYEKGGPIVSPYGQWLFNGKKKKEDTIIPSNNITMANVNYPVLGISDAGDAKIMMPWNNYKFRGSIVYEHPLIDNQFQLGGLAKPFSYGDIPDVRYLKGGNIFLEKGFISKIKPIEEYITPIEPQVLDNTYVVRNYPYYLLPEVLNGNKRLSDEEISNYYGSNIVWTMENPKHKGLNPDGTYSAYEDEAGFNFGPGLHAKSNNLDINKTYTKQELDSIASNIALNYMKQISDDLETMQDGKYTGVRDTLSAGPLLTMLDIAYNVKPKNKGNMPQKWPNLTDSLINGNIEKAKENTYSGSTRRQKMRNQMIVYKPLEGITVHNEALGGNLFKKGGIYIKPENRGKFTALKKRTGHSASWFKAHGTPALKKMATFALNSRHWNKHALGGYLEGEVYDLPEEEIMELINAGYEIEYL